MPMRPEFEQQMIGQIAGFRHKDSSELLQRLNRQFDSMTDELTIPESDAEKLLELFFTGFKNTIASAETILSNLEAANGKIQAESKQTGIPPARLAGSIYREVIEDQTIGDRSEQKHL